MHCSKDEKEANPIGWGTAVKDQDSAGQNNCSSADPLFAYGPVIWGCYKMGIMVIWYLTISQEGAQS